MYNFTLHLSHSPKRLGRHWIAVSIREYAYRHIIYSTKPWGKKHAVSSGDYDSFKKSENNTSSRVCTVHVYNYLLIRSKWQEKKLDIQMFFRHRRWQNVFKKDKITQKWKGPVSKSQPPLKQNCVLTVFWSMDVFLWARSDIFHNP